MDNTLKLVSVRRDRGRAILTLSNGETLTMPRSMLKERPYRGGMPFDHCAFHTFIAERSYSYAMEKAVALLAMRPRTQQEIVKALSSNAYPEQTIARVMARLDEAGYVNDTDFAEQWASSRSAKSMGARRIQMELRQKGVDSDTIALALSNLDADDMFSGALIRMGEELGIPMPYNTYTYHIIKALEEKNDGLFDYSGRDNEMIWSR